ncbi:MAG: DUF507 family protein [Deltaproteobacteria bacterium]|nr:DUF507 family protein [Deltaproteobacteria bacterium]MBW1922659.1 DUF507 family protein [Deltaproteobacteria bacterium]MBW1948730.1 DUF507 family protein [Deltaproteobacteria bacterium]MBW2007630.1 DUF507 family protein [Deltaproteobacteria bacterium]MBW2103447.1 DUF507 family protein [Deltaproteobacteria bacterium]
MKRWDTGRVQDKIVRHLERQERQRAFQQDRFFRLKLPEIHNKLTQTLLMEGIVETDDAAGFSEALLKGLKKAVSSSEFDFKYFIAPIRDLVPRPNPYSLYVTQYIMEVLIDDPSVIDIYGTDTEIYRVVNDVISRINIRFEKAEDEILAQLARNKSLRPGSRQYDIAMEQLFHKKFGDPQKV